MTDKRVVIESLVGNAREIVNVMCVGGGSPWIIMGKILSFSLHIPIL